MVLCAVCRAIDFGSLLDACLEQYQNRREAYFSDRDSTLPPPDIASWIKQHGDIFELEKCFQWCDLCRVIFQAFEREMVVEKEDARGLPIVFRPARNKIEVCYKSEEGLINLCRLDAYMEDDDAIACYGINTFPEDVSPPILKKLDKDPGSKKFLDITSGFLRSCQENHGSCNRSLESWNPLKRLINVGTQTRSPFLVDIFPALRKVEWVSLSYCWGEEPSMKLTENTISILRHGIALSRLDPTIRDVIFITRAFGIPYIWIDALCIVQDLNGAEWNEEASRMHEIYGGRRSPLSSPVRAVL
ncbi:hypothetical protein B0H67DRAFT_97924 [Lasiosphaeris hirsuta]|uniref:Heterokaryon incompatibility domain-containing protein n=1 Tax=Lasiosphaeris hirsuta TaxID=260670 RepID=A0AA39ZPI1_9PEZI|nr:hypothetical protein B0H67DRAFT_97924 [Lasiosphaeris hirsuta]